MNKLFSTRNSQVLAFFIILMAILIIRLFSLTVVQGEDWKAESESVSMKNIYTTAPRGEIRDRYGRLLAANKPRFIVQLVADEMEPDNINPTIEKLIGIFEQNGDTYIDTFPIVYHDGIFEFTYQQDIRNWLISQEMPVNFTAKQAFEEVCRRQNISEDLDKYAAQEELQVVYNIFPPISIRNMQFTKQNEQKTFLDKYGLDENISAKDAFYAIADRFKIDKSLSAERIRKILIMRDSLKSQGYKKYIPVKVASDISLNTIVNIEEIGDDLKGVVVQAEPVRYYPYGSTAAHVLGYLGQISESEKEEYAEKGYNGNTMVGKDGIEKAFENSLKGTDGVKQIEVNATGNMERLISETQSQKGKDVYLTIDIELQKVAEEALEKGLAQIRRGGSFPSEWGNYNYSKAYKNANAGAAVVLDVKTGDVLAMASYPQYDPNLFATGISKEDWEALQTQNPRDPLSPIPLYNIAARTAVQPGSIFKMVTGTSAMDKGLDPNRRLYDGGYIQMGDKTFGCSLWNSYRSSHGYVNMVEAIEVSCNYYFYDAGSGKDWKNKKAITKEPITIETMMEYAKMYGLGVSTGIEIPETVYAVPSREKKLADAKTALKNTLARNAKDYFEVTVSGNQALLERTIDQIVSWVGESPEPGRGEVRQRLIELGVRNITVKNVENPLEKLTDSIKYGAFRQAKWTDADQLNISIGQGENSYTPLQMANYIATIANGGTLNKVSLIKGIQDQPDLEREQGTVMPIQDLGTLKYLREGMLRVTTGSRGTARGSFGNFPIQVAGKTGTAQRSNRINPPDEVEHVKKYLSRINSRITFDQVETEMARLMLEDPEKYASKNYAVREAVVNLTPNRKRTAVLQQIDSYKPTYDNFAWFVGFAPYDEPEIAIAILLVQGGSGGYAAPIAREIIAEYMDIKATYDEYDTQNKLTQ